MNNTQNYREEIDRRLAEFFVLQPELPLSAFGEAMRYSLLAGGKRIRSILLLEFCRICGGDMTAALDAACAVEMAHTFSLIHDDLPCMDNDDLRRGMPTNHIVYGEYTATLAGDALCIEAFRTLLHSSLSPEARLRCAALLSDGIGFEGMCGGQYLDMLWEGRKLSSRELDDINCRKTGALLRACCAMGVAAAEGSRDLEEAAADFGSAIGMAFQIRDDMLDVLSTEEELGKPIGSDEAEQKNTYMALLGPDNCEKEIQMLTEQAKEILRKHFKETKFLEEFADSLAARKN